MLALALLLIAAPPSSSSASTQHLVGVIEGTPGVFVELKRSGDVVTGTYHYRARAQVLQLKGSVDAKGTMTLEETAPTTTTGRMTLTPPDAYLAQTTPKIAWIGTWTSPDGSGARSVTLQERADVVVNGDSFVVADARGRMEDYGEFEALTFHKLPVIWLATADATTAAARAVRSHVPDDNLGFDAHVVEGYVVIGTESCGNRVCMNDHIVVDVVTGADRTGLAFFGANRSTAIAAISARRQSEFAALIAKAPKACLDVLRSMRATPLDNDLDIEPVAGGVVVHFGAEIDPCAGPADVRLSTSDWAK